MTSAPHGSSTPVPGTVTPSLAPDPQPLDPADLVVSAVLGVAGVAAMHAGMFGEVATHLPGRKVVGVQIRPDVTNVDVVLDWGVSVPETARRVQEIVESLVGTSAHVTVQDVTDPGVRARL